MKQNEENVQNMQNEHNSSENKTGKISLGLTIAIIAAITVVIIILIALIGSRIANKKIAEIAEQSQMQVLDEIDEESIDEEPEEEMSFEEMPIEEMPIEDDNDQNVEKDTTADAGSGSGNDGATQPGKPVPDTDTSNLKKMTDDEFTLCWYNDKYLNKIPLMGLGTYETILQKDNFSTAIISGLTKDDIKEYCEHKGAEGDLDLNGFTKNAMVVSDKESAYSYQVTNKDGITAYISWADGVATFTVGVD